MSTSVLLLKEPLQLEDVLILALRLPPVDKAKLVERIVVTLENDLALTGTSTSQTSEQINAHPPKPRRSLLGLWSKWGPGPSAEEIDDVRREISKV